MLKRLVFLVLIILFSINVLAEDSNLSFSGNISEITLKDGKGSNVVDLSLYFNGTNLEYKYKAGKLGINGLKISINSNGKVDMEANDKATKSVIFLADDDIKVVQSNEVKVFVTGEIQEVSFSPNTQTVELKEGESKVFAVSGNQSVKWYLDGVLLNYTGNTYEFNENIVKVYTLKVAVGTTEKSWSVSVLSKAIVETPNVTDVPEIEQPVCGNGLRESGEDCSSCPADVSCSSNSRCESGICVPVKSGNLVLWLGLFGGILVFVAAGIILIRQKWGWSRIFRKKQETIIQQEIPVQEAVIDNLEPLRNYFNINLKNYKKEELIKQALSQGWSQEQIDEVLKGLGNDNFK